MLFFGVVVLISFKIVTEFNTNIQANADIPANAKTATTSLLGYFPGVIDHMFLFLTIGLALVSLALAALVRVHPIFLPFFLIALGFVIFFSGLFSNIYQTMAANAVLSTEAAQLTFISHILEYLPIIVGVFGTILMVVLYKLGDGT